MSKFTNRQTKNPNIPSKSTNWFFFYSINLLFFSGAGPAAPSPPAPWPTTLGPWNVIKVFLFCTEYTLCDWLPLLSLHVPSGPVCLRFTQCPSPVLQVLIFYISVIFSIEFWRSCCCSCLYPPSADPTSPPPNSETHLSSHADEGSPTLPWSGEGGAQRSQLCKNSCRQRFYIQVKGVCVCLYINHSCFFKNSLIKMIDRQKICHHLIITDRVNLMIWALVKVSLT